MGLTFTADMSPPRSSGSDHLQSYACTSYFRSHASSQVPTKHLFAEQAAVPHVPPFAPGYTWVPLNNMPLGCNGHALLFARLAAIEDIERLGRKPL